MPTRLPAVLGRGCGGKGFIWLVLDLLQCTRNQFCSSLPVSLAFSLALSALVYKIGFIYMAVATVECGAVTGQHVVVLCEAEFGAFNQAPFAAKLFVTVLGYVFFVFSPNLGFGVQNPSYRLWLRT